MIETANILEDDEWLPANENAQRGYKTLELLAREFVARRCECLLDPLDASIAAPWSAGLRLIGFDGESNERAAEVHGFAGMLIDGATQPLDANHGIAGVGSADHGVNRTCA